MELTYTIPQAAKEAECTEAWVRAAIRSKELPSTLVPNFPGSEVKHHEIRREDLIAWTNRTGKRMPRREDKRARWIMYGTPDEINRLKERIYQTDDEGLKIVAASIRPNSAKEAM